MDIDTVLLFTVTLEVKTLGATATPAEVEVGDVLLGEEGGAAVVANRVRPGQPFLREAVGAGPARVVRVRAGPFGFQHGQGRAARGGRGRRRRVQERRAEPHESLLLEDRAGVGRRLVVEHRARVAVRGSVLADRRADHRRLLQALLRGLDIAGGLRLHRRLRLGRQLFPQLVYLERVTQSIYR